MRIALQRLARLGLFVLVSAVFAGATTQYPLYDGNYNTYLLHGLARAGVGHLAGDWLAQTTDPFPLVSTLVALTIKLASPTLFYAYHALFLGLYLMSLLSIARSLSGERSRTRDVAFLGFAIFLHGALFRAAVERLTGGDWGWYLQSGVAQQYLLGFVFQPSLFGVLAIASIAAFLRGVNGLAVALACAATYAHASYALSSVSLVLAYGLVRYIDGRATDDRIARRTCLRIWVMGAIALAPIVAFIAVRFAPSSAAALHRAQEILVELRIPHHARPVRWLKLPAALTAMLVTLGLVVVRKSRLAIVILVPTLIALILTLFEMVTENRTLALLFPWRVSVIVAPLSTAVILAKMLPRELSSPRLVKVLAGCGIFLAVASFLFGVRTTHDTFAEYDKEDTLGALRFVKATNAAEALYLIPPALSRFRLETGARTYVDWKSHPYRDVEVLEWYARTEKAKAFERASGAEACRMADELSQQAGITHFVVEANKDLSCAALERVYADQVLVVFRHRFQS